MSTLAPDRSGRIDGADPPPARHFLWLRRPRERTAAAPLPIAAATAVWFTAAISVFALWLLLYAFVLSGLQQHRTNTVLYAALRERLTGLAKTTVPLGGAIKPGTPIALLKAPQAGLPNEVIVEGTAPGDLTAGPGHRRNTPLPGQAGVSVLYGRSATFGAPFAHVTRLEHGDKLTVTTGQGTFTYVVDGVRHAGDPTPAQLPDGGGRLSLVTATGSRFAPSKTVYVDATLQGATQPTPPGRPASVPQSEQAMQGDPSGLIFLVLWLMALVAVAVGAAWARLRWGLWQAWVVGIPILIAVLWGASRGALMLLPNLV
jgi:sortase A